MRTKERCESGWKNGAVCVCDVRNAFRELA